MPYHHHAKPAVAAPSPSNPLTGGSMGISTSSLICINIRHWIQHDIAAIVGLTFKGDGIETIDRSLQSNQDSARASFWALANFCGPGVPESQNLWAFLFGRLKIVSTQPSERYHLHFEEKNCPPG